LDKAGFMGEATAVGAPNAWNGAAQSGQPPPTQAVAEHAKSEPLDQQASAGGAVQREPAYLGGSGVT